jgi:broad specificity phosphatase PhoE
MTASKIMIIRHAEKPDEAGTVLGVTINGDQDPDELTVRGWQRAGALATFFAPPDANFRDQRIEKPVTIFASRVAPHKSLRPQHTVKPLAELVGREKLRLDFSEGEEQQLVAAVEAVAGVALISWHHEAIPAIKDLFLGDQTPSRKWDKERFDLVWVFTRTAASWRFEQVPQLLLAGDKPNPIE